MFRTRHAVNEVFTPRRTEVNREIYVDRPDLEKELRRSLTGSLHSIIYGESGSGKSWLYKKVLADMNATVATANCANALRFQSLTDEIKYVVASQESRQLSEYAEEMNASANAVFAQGGLKTTRKYDVVEVDPLLDCFRMLREKAKQHPAVLVIDNLEMIFASTDLMAELASIITLLDDSRYAAYSVKLLIVGVPSGVKDYLATSYTSVANRISEISEVNSLTRDEVSTLVKKGFINLLNVTFQTETLAKWQEHVFRAARVNNFETVGERI